MRPKEEKGALRNLNFPRKMKPTERALCDVVNRVLGNSI